MSKKVKVVIIICALVVAAFIGSTWYQDYEATHEEIPAAVGPAQAPAGDDVKE